MKINTVNTQNSFSFGTQIRRTSALGWGVNRAIELGDKGFINALKHLSNDGLNREILVAGSHAQYNNKIIASAYLYVDKLHQYTSKSAQRRTDELGAVQLMGEHVIELFKRLARETGNISKKALGETATTDILVKESNEAYRTIIVG